MATKEFLRKLRQKYHLGEYKTGRSKPAKPKRVRRVRRARVVRHSRRVFSMARRRSRRVSHRKGMLGGSDVGGLLKPALIGVGAAHFAGFIPFNVPLKEEAVGAAAAYFVGGKRIKSAAVGAGAVWLMKNMGAVSSGGTAGF